MAFFDAVEPLVIAHRGLARGVPENTLPAFVAALAAGADILETDVHLSRDGHVIIAHDPTLARVAGRPGWVSDYSAHELAGMDQGGGVGFLTLAELLEALPRAKVNIDLKTPQVVPAFVDVIRQLGAQDRVLVASFSDTTRVHAISQLPGVATSASSRHFLPGLLAATLDRPRWLARVFSGVDAIQAPYSYRGVRIASERFIDSLRSIDKHIHVWTVNDPTQMHQLLTQGVTGIVTDRADLAVGVRNEYLSLGETP